MACAAYVDLNPIRAAIAETIEDSQHTSVKRRVSALQTEVANNVSEDISPIDRSVDAPDCFLSPVSVDERNDPLGPRPSRSGKRCSDKGFIALADAEYLEILDWLARNTVSNKRGSTPEHAPKVFERLCIDPVVWAEMVKNFGRKFKSVAGVLSNPSNAPTITVIEMICSISVNPWSVTAVARLGLLARVPTPLVSAVGGCI